MCLGAPSIFTSLQPGLPVSWRSVAACEEKKGDQHTTMTDWLGTDCPVDFLNVWFPAIGHQLYCVSCKYRGEHRLWFDDPAMA